MTLSFNDVVVFPDPYQWSDTVFGSVEYKHLSLDQQAEVAELIQLALANNRQQQEPRDPGVPFTNTNLALAMGIDDADKLPPGVYDIFLKYHAHLRM